MEECYDLKQQIDVLIKQAKLKIFLGQDHKDERQPMKGKAEEAIRPSFGEIKIVVGGMSIGSLSRVRMTYLQEVQNVQISRQPPSVDARPPSSRAFVRPPTVVTALMHVRPYWKVPLEW